MPKGRASRKYAIRSYIEDVQYLGKVSRIYAQDILSPPYYYSNATQQSASLSDLNLNVAVSWP